jgi:SAM-dependent methyltransferase
LGAASIRSTRRFQRSLPVLQAETIAIFDSQGEAYRQAFQTFLDHTDQKEQARGWLNRLVDTLPRRRVFIDAGAGNGKVTAWFTGRFERTLAIEPNPHLRRELAESCPNAELIADGILTADLAASADFVLCSHVFYYIDRAAWLATLESLASWLAPGGSLVVVLQNHESDCMRMLDRFYGRRFDLSQLAAEFRGALGGQYHIGLETSPAAVQTSDFATAATIAEFMLNLLPLGGEADAAEADEEKPRRLPAPARDEAACYIRQHFADGRGGFRFSCNQDFLMVRRAD